MSADKLKPFGVKAESARIFYARYRAANDDPEYRALRKAHRLRYG